MKFTQFLFIITICALNIHAQTYSGYFESSGSTGRAVFGLALSTSSTNYGGWFKAKGLGGRGVYGVSSNSSGANYGGYFESSGSSGRGVYGSSLSPSGLNYGGYFESAGSTGRAVFGLASATSDVNYGGWFKAKGREGRGVYGESSDVNGTNYGGYFLSKSIAGRAVFGLADYVQDGTNFGGWFKGKGSAGGTGVYGWGGKYDFYADGPGTNYASSSSRRWKSNIVNIDNPLEKLALLRGVYYDWDEEHGGQHDMGFIAEEVGEIVPEIVAYEENGVDATAMDYSKMTPLLLEAANAMRKEYQDKFDQQQSEINQLKIQVSAINKLTREIAELKTLLRAQSQD